jgi:hypothetical protein
MDKISFDEKVALWQQNINADTVIDIESMRQNHLTRLSNNTSLGLKLLSIAGGIFATFFFSWFLIILNLFDNEWASITLGIIFIVGGIILFNRIENLVLDTLGVGIFLIGYSLLYFGAETLIKNNSWVAVIMAIVALITLYFVRQYIFAFISAIIFLGAIPFIFVTESYINSVHIINNIFVILMTFWILKEAQIISTYKKYSKLYEPFRMALIIVVIALYLFLIIVVRFEEKSMASWPSSLAPIAMLCLVASRLINIFDIKEKSNQWYIYILLLIILGYLFIAPGILISLLVLVLGVYVQHKISIALGITSLIGFSSYFYYNLEWTLLEKSITLMIVGLALLFIYYLSFNFFESNEKI